MKHVDRRIFHRWASLFALICISKATVVVSKVVKLTSIDKTWLLALRKSLFMISINAAENPRFLNVKFQSLLRRYQIWDQIVFTPRTTSLFPIHSIFTLCYWSVVGSIRCEQAPWQSNLEPRYISLRLMDFPHQVLLDRLFFLLFHLPTFDKATADPHLHFPDYSTCFPFLVCDRCLGEILNMYHVRRSFVFISNFFYAEFCSWPIIPDHA